MRKLVKAFLLIALIISVISIWQTVKDHSTLQDQLIRLHVVANSDSDADQSVKLEVRDAVLKYLQPVLDTVTDPEQAKAYLNAHLAEIKKVADSVLEKYGKEYKATVSLQLETFGKRIYDTFSLPAGVYESLRIKLGDAQGKNWWCVVFPALCVPTEKDAFCETAVSVGINESLTNTLAGENGYEIRFFLMDCFGKIENLFFTH